MQQHGAEVAAAAVVDLVAGAGVRRGGLRQPLLHPGRLHGGGERLVERGVVAHVDHLMGQFVEDQPGQFALGLVDEGVE
ncbi:hypothetical protein D3C84_998110 [compost metagenome]